MDASVVPLCVLCLSLFLLSQTGTDSCNITTLLHLHAAGTVTSATLIWHDSYTEGWLALQNAPCKLAQPCRLHAAGRCPFKHDAAEQAPQHVSAAHTPAVDPNTTGKLGVFHPPESLYKTVECKSFKASGSCPYGSQCGFAHGKQELRVPSLVGAMNPAPHKVPVATPCKYGVGCKRQATCMFQHPTVPAVVPIPMFQYPTVPAVAPMFRYPTVPVVPMPTVSVHVSRERTTKVAPDPPRERRASASPPPPQFNPRNILSELFDVAVRSSGSAIVTPAQLSQFILPSVLAQLAAAFQLKGHSGHPVTITKVLRAASHFKWVQLQESYNERTKGNNVTGAQWVFDGTAPQATRPLRKARKARAPKTAAAAAAAAATAAAVAAGPRMCVQGCGRLVESPHPKHKFCNACAATNKAARLAAGEVSHSSAATSVTSSMVDDDSDYQEDLEPGAYNDSWDEDDDLE
jgi:hypothetical protein